MSNLILPPMYKDMTFYSWMATTHMINGYPSAYQLSEKLLGNGSAGTRLDFPSHLAKFCSNTSNAFGDVYSLSKNSTVLPYYLTFRPINLIDNCVRLMASNSVEHLKFILGLPPTHAHQFSNLKFCPECFELDVQVHGYGYWHRSHQLSSTHVCTTHGEQLRVCRLREDGRGKTELALPSLHSSYGIQVSTNSHPLLESLSELSVRALMSLLPSEFNPKQLQFTYQHGLKQHGLITPGGLIRVNEFLYRLHKYFGPILSISPYDKLLSQDRLKHFLKLIRKPRGFQHTVTHLLLIQFLFGSWDLFCSTYEWESQFKLDFTPAPQLDNASVNNSFDEILYEIAIRYKSGESLRKLALRHNYDIGTLMRQLGKFNLATIKRRPKKVTREVIDFVLNLLSQGHSLKSISLETSLSKSSIDRICTSNPSIQQVWKQNKKDTLRAQKRADLTQCIVDNPLTTKSAIKASMPSTINWLTAHDIVWLKQNLKTVNTDRGHRTPQTSKPRINWMERDDECLKALQEIRNIKLESWERRKPQAFLRRLPTLSFKPRLSNLPKSKEWVTSALERLNESIG